MAFVMENSPARRNHLCLFLATIERKNMAVRSYSLERKATIDLGNDLSIICEERKADRFWVKFWDTHRSNTFMLPVSEEDYKRIFDDARLANFEYQYVKAKKLEENDE